MRGEREDVFSRSISFSLQRVKTRERTSDLSKTRDKISRWIQKQRKREKKFSAPTSVPLLCKDQVKRSKKIRTKSLGFKCLSCTQISLPECFFLTRRAKIQKTAENFTTERGENRKK